MNGNFFKLLKGYKNKIFSLIAVLIFAIAVFYIVDTWKSKTFLQLYAIEGDVISARVSGSEFSNLDLNADSANRILEALKGNQYSNYGKKQDVIQGNLYHITLSTASQHYDITISDASLLLTSDRIYKMSGKADVLEVINKEVKER